MKKYTVLVVSCLILSAITIDIRAENNETSYTLIDTEESSIIESNGLILDLTGD